MRNQTWPCIAVIGLFGLSLFTSLLAATPWLFPLAFLAVLVAARFWPRYGGLAASLVAGGLLWHNLWRHHRAGLLTDQWLLAGYAAASVALLITGCCTSILQRERLAAGRLATELAQSRQRLKTVHRIALSLSTTLDVNQLLEIILEQLGQLWGHDYGAVLLLDEETGDLVLTAARGYMQEIGTRIPADASVCGQAVQEGAPVCVADVTADDRYMPGVPGARSELAVPLIWDNRVLGVLNVESCRPDAYSQADISLLTTVAEQAAAAIGNASLHQQTRRLAVTDEQTGLFNYRHFQEQLTLILRDAQITGSPCSLIMMDLDHFKQCNDTYGHPTGDCILEQTATVLQDSCRHSDLLFRYGGDEFTIILPDTGSEAAARVGERIRERLARYPFTTRSGRAVEIAVTASLGIATYPRDGMTPVDLVLAADRALYAAKNAGRNRVDTAARQEVT